MRKGKATVIKQRAIVDITSIPIYTQKDSKNVVKAKEPPVVIEREMSFREFMENQSDE